MMDLVGQGAGRRAGDRRHPVRGIESGQAFNTGKCDVAAAGMTITEEREEVDRLLRPVLRRHPGAAGQEGPGSTSSRSSRARRSASRPPPPGRSTPRRTPPTARDHGVRGPRPAAHGRSRPADRRRDQRQRRAATTTSRRTPRPRSTTEFDTGEQYGFGGRRRTRTTSCSTTVNEAIADGQGGRHVRQDLQEVVRRRCTCPAEPRLTAACRHDRQRPTMAHEPAQASPDVARASSTPCWSVARRGARAAGRLEHARRGLLRPRRRGRCCPRSSRRALKNTSLYTACGFAFGLVARAWCWR